MSIPSREGLTQEVPYRIEGLNVSVSREAHVGRSGDSARFTPRDLRRRLHRQSLSRNAASATATARTRGTTTRLLCYARTGNDGLILSYF
jgi:hypothetical protein